MGDGNKVIFSGRIVSLLIEEHELPDGRRASFEIVRHSGGAAVLPVMEDGRVILIRQFRPAAGGMVWEIPAGRLEGGEPPETCLHRELREEVGVRAASLERLGEMLTAVGFCDEVVHLFVARGLTEVPRALEPDEYIDVVPMAFDEAMAMLRRGEIPDGKTQLALFLYQQRNVR